MKEYEVVVSVEEVYKYRLKANSSSEAKENYLNGDCVKCYGSQEEIVDVVEVIDNWRLSK